MTTPYFSWDAEMYSVGDATIDSQHQNLLSALNDLYDLIHARKEADQGADTAALMSKLTRFIVEHFSYEEQRLQESQYPLDLLERHRAEHNRFVRKIQDFEQRLQDGDPSVLDEMLPYLYGDWLLQHICGTDMGYRDYLHPADSTSAENSLS